MAGSDHGMERVIEEIEALYRSHGSAILGYLRRITGDNESVEDLFQDTFAQALRRRDRVVGAFSPRAWLFGIARNIAMNSLRRRRAFVSLPEQLPVASPDQNPGMEPMREAIARLPAELQETLALRLGEDLSYAEIALVLGIPPGTVRSRLHRAVRQLRRIMRGAST